MFSKSLFRVERRAPVLTREQGNADTIKKETFSTDSKRRGATETEDLMTMVPPFAAARPHHGGFRTAGGTINEVHAAKTGNSV